MIHLHGREAVRQHNATLCFTFSDFIVAAVLCAVHVQHLKAVQVERVIRSYDRIERALFPGYPLLLGQRERAFVWIPFDFHALVHCTGHHACTSEKGVVY